MGAGGRETVDKSVTVDEARELMGLDKATISTADQNDAPDSDFAYIEPGGEKDSGGKTVPRNLRHFYIADAAHVRNALARASQSPFGEKAMPKIVAAAKKFGIEVSDDASKGQLDGSVFSAPNPALADPVSQGTDPAAGGDDDSTDADASVPGSPAWEAVDAATATAAAQALITAAGLLQTFCQREAQEVIAGEGSDVVDVYMAQDAICAIQSALGTVAQLAFHEGLEAAKSLPDDEVVEKAGRRLAGKTITALAAARDKAKDLADHIGGVLGNDDPKKPSSGIKSAADNDLISKEIEDMTGDELMQLLDERDARKAAEVETAEKGAVAQNAKDSIAAGKDANDKAKGKDPKADDKDLEDEAEDNDDGSTNSPKGAAKSTDTEDAEVTDDTEVEKSDETVDADDVKVELTPEQIEAKKARKEAKKQLREAKEAEKIAAETAALTKALEESRTQAEEAVKALEEASSHR